MDGWMDGYVGSKARPPKSEKWKERVLSTKRSLVLGLVLYLETCKNRGTWTYNKQASERWSVSVSYGSIEFESNPREELVQSPQGPPLAAYFKSFLTLRVGEEQMGGEGQGGARACEKFTPGYYAVCTIGGMFSAGTTHLVTTPLDVLKVNMQVNPLKYYGMLSGFSTLWKEQGSSSLWKGWSAKFCGYGVQGACKFGLYEYFRSLYADILVDYNRTFIFFLSSASAQVFADIALCPFESVKVRVQAQPHFAKGLSDGFPKVYKTEGLAGFYGGLFPLWCRNLPFSMIMFSTFEHSVDFIYQKLVQKRKEDCSSVQQLGVTCLAGYTAGAVGTLISNPADNIVASLYNKKAENALQAVKKIGFLNLFTRSLPVRITIVGPVVTSQWFLYDSIKVLNGLPTSGGLPRRIEEANLSA